MLRSDGGYRAAAFNAATLALMDAGIGMRDMVVATTSGLLGSVPVLDLIHDEERKQNCELVIAYFISKGCIVYEDLSCNKISAIDH